MIAFMAHVNVYKRVMLGLDRFGNEGQARLFWSSATFFDIAIDTSTDDIFPNRFSAHTSWGDMVERQLAGGEFPAAILTVILVAGKDVPSIKLDFISRQSVVEQQPNNFRHSNIKINGSYPVVTIRFEIPFELAYITPTVEIIGGISTFLIGNYLGKLAEE